MRSIHRALNIPGRLAWAGPNEDLRGAAKNGDVRGVEAAIKAKADINAGENNGETALMWATANGHANVVSLLLKAGADVNARNTDGDTAEDIARKNSHLEIISLIERYARVQKLTQGDQNDDLSKVQDALSGGVDPNTMYGSSGETPLWDAVNRGYADIVMALLSHGADANMAYQGKTPLYVAAENGNTEMIQPLLSHGANPGMTYNGKTPLEAAKENGHDDIVQLLRSSTGP